MKNTVDYQTVIRHLNTFVKEKQIVVDEIEIEKTDSADKTKIAAVITLRLPVKMIHLELIEQVSVLEGVIYVEEL